MNTSLDGRLLTQRWSSGEDDLLALYDGAAARLDAERWIVGRQRMAHYLPSGPPNSGPAPTPRPDRIAVRRDGGLGICFDRQGRLCPESGEINGAFLAAGLIDETSTLVYPVLDGQRGIPAIYDHGAETQAQALDLISAETMDGGTVWLRHRLRRA